MAPALTQAAEPPTLAEATHHTSPPPLISSPGGIKCLKNNKILLSEKSLINGDRCTFGLAPPACGWAEGRPSASPGSCTMEELPPLHQSDSGSVNDLHMDTQQVHTQSATSPSLAPTAYSDTNNMGCQAPTTNCSIPELKGGGSSSFQEDTIMNTQQNELIALMGRDFSNVNEIIDTLQKLASNPELLNATDRGVDAPAGTRGSAIVPNESQEERASTAIGKLASRQKQLERRKVFLLRRLRRVTARGLGAAVSAQLNHLVREGKKHMEEERCRSQLSDSVEDVDEPLALETLPTESMKNMTTTDLVSLVRRVEASHNLHQKNAASRVTTHVRAAPTLPIELCAEADVVAAEMKAAALEHVHHDSDATESSSGGESCDENEGYECLDSFKPIRERAYYKYCQKRGFIASKWVWLQAQIADLDYKISEQQKVYGYLRTSKGQVIFIEEAANNKVKIPVRNPAHFDMQDPALTCLATSPSMRTTLNGYHPPNKIDEVPLCDLSANSYESDSCARTLGVARVKRRRYMRPSVILRRNRGLNGGTIHRTTNCGDKPKSQTCHCVLPLSCVLCVKPQIQSVHNIYGGHLSRLNKLQSLVINNRPFPEKLESTDRSFHHVLSGPQEMLQTEIYSSVLCSYEWQEKTLASRTIDKRDSVSPTNIDSEPLTKRKKRDKDYKRIGRRIREGSRERLLIKTSHPQPAPEMEVDVDVGRWHVSSNRSSSRDSPCPSPVFDKHEKSSSGKQESNSKATAPRRHFTSSRNKQNHTSSSYDINNIVIPYSMASPSMVESLCYKEILTPEWRVKEIQPIENISAFKEDVYEEDLSDEAFAIRHSHSEELERKKFFHCIHMKANSRPSRSRRTDSSGTNTPDHPLSPRPLDSFIENSPVGSPLQGLSEDSNQSTSTTKSTQSANQATVLTLSLSSIQSSLLKLNSSNFLFGDTNQSASEEPEQLDTHSDSSVHKWSSASENLLTFGPPSSRTRRALSTTSQEKTFAQDQPISHLEDESKSEVSPFPSRKFPLDESEYGVLITEESCKPKKRDSLNGDRSELVEEDTVTSCRLPKPTVHVIQNEKITAVENEVESGRETPLSELTDSAPEEDICREWDDSAPPDWTISAVQDKSGCCVMQVQRH